MLLFSINRSQGYENPILDIIVIELFSIGAFPLEEACEHFFQIQSLISVVILITFQCYCGEYSGYIAIILPLLRILFQFCIHFISGILQEGFFITMMMQIHCIYINVEPKRKMKKDQRKPKTCINQIGYS
jgi:hypothetical protein